VVSRDRARVFGVFGDPVDHSLSPAMHNAAFATARLPHVYLRFPVTVRALPAAMREARALRMGGLNLTVPLKEAVIPLLDEVTPEARRIGAVNTVVFAGHRLVGDNTDGRGFLRALGAARTRRAAAVLIGAGGSARAVGTALAQAGAARIVVANRTPVRGEALAAHLAALGPAEITTVPLSYLARGHVLEDATLVVHATPLGLHGARPALRYDASPRRCLFVDLVYASRPTPFLAGAHRAGRATLDGARMLLEQGALAFEAWTGRPAPRPAMAGALAAAGLRLRAAGGPA
jgi:shikimate dehydrogenase